MKTYNSIIQLINVPETISRETNGDIAEGMFLSRDAIESLQNGDMFSPLDCMWSYADIVAEEDVTEIKMQLLERGIMCKIITIFPHC